MCVQIKFNVVLTLYIMDSNPLTSFIQIKFDVVLTSCIQIEFDVYNVHVHVALTSCIQIQVSSCNLQKLIYRILGNFWNNVIFGRTLRSKNIIIGQYASSVNFRKAENILNICLFEIILSKIFLI